MRTQKEKERTKQREEAQLYALQSIQPFGTDRFVKKRSLKAGRLTREVRTCF